MSDILLFCRVDRNWHAPSIPGAAFWKAHFCIIGHGWPNFAAHSMPLQGWLRSKGIEVIEFDELTPKEARAAYALGLPPVLSHVEFHR